MKMLNMNDPNFKSKLLREIGVKDGDRLQISTPQFERVDGIEVCSLDITMKNLKTLSYDALKAAGCLPWTKPDENNTVLMLFPYQWYEKIPDGLDIENICGEKEKFKRGVTSDDYRFGVLSFGVCVKAGENHEPTTL